MNHPIRENFDWSCRSWLGVLKFCNGNTVIFSEWRYLTHVCHCLQNMRELIVKSQSTQIKIYLPSEMNPTIVKSSEIEMKWNKYKVIYKWFSLNNYQWRCHTSSIVRSVLPKLEFFIRNGPCSNHIQIELSRVNLKSASHQWLMHPISVELNKR